MASKKREIPETQHAEGRHGDKTHSRFVEQLHEGEPAKKSTQGAPVNGHHRLHQDREQHDEAEKNSEKVEAMRELQRGKVDENVIAHARVSREADGK